MFTLFKVIKSVKLQLVKAKHDKKEVSFSSSCLLLLNLYDLKFPTLIHTILLFIYSCVGLFNKDRAHL